MDPGRLAAAGGSAGGHLAACTGLVPGFEADGEDTSISSRPDAMILVNPVLVLAPVEGLLPEGRARLEGIADRLAVDPRALSPLHHVASNRPSHIIFHGRDDATVPYRSAE